MPCTQLSVIRQPVVSFIIFRGVVQLDYYLRADSRCIVCNHILAGYFHVVDSMASVIEQPAWLSLLRDSQHVDLDGLNQLATRMAIP